MGGRTMIPEFDPTQQEIDEREESLITGAESPNESTETDGAWPSIESQLEYWKTHDHGGNVLPCRIEANEERYQ